MEAKNSKSTEFLGGDCNVSDMSANNNVAEEALLSSESNTIEDKDSTKTLLEDVCTDFESMDVINPKNNKIYVMKRGISTSPTNKIDQKKNSGTNIIVHKTTFSDKSTVNEVSDSNSLPVVNEVQVNTFLCNEMNSRLNATSGAFEIEPLEQTNASVLNAKPYTESNPEILPSNNCQNPSNITMLPESFAGEGNIPLAQLADAEIVQSGDKVSIIVTNTRLIKVLTNTNNSESSVPSVIDPTSVILETNVGSSQQIDIIDSTVLSNSSFQDLNIIDDSPAMNEAIISDSESFATAVTEKESELTEDQLNVLRKQSTPKGRPMKKALRRPYTETGSSTKARRITAKMKSEWARQLEVTGRLVCGMPGCSQTYVTVANFQTHYKYCTGKKNLQHCLYCDSLIFSSHKAVLHHMEVEHPEKVEEYKAQFSEETAEFEEDGLSHLIVAEDENVAMNVEEVTQQPLKNSRKRKLSSKENVVSKKHCILKHKMQSNQNIVTENIKEFKKCVRFGDIVDKINSVDIANSLELPSDTQDKGSKQKKERRKIILTESIVSEEKYFEDDEDEPPKDSEEHPQINTDKLNTKARMLLNMERYKRYKEYLKLTRDWSSERKTYSRSRTSDTSFDSSYLMALQNEYIQDTHQLNDTTESSSISLNTSETEINPNVSYLQTFEALEANQFVSPVTTEPGVAAVSEPPISTASKADKNPLNELTPSEHPISSTEKSYAFEPIAKREKTACYNRPNLSNVQNKVEASRSKPVKFEGIITYGMTVPGQMSKSIEPAVTFDSLINSIQQKQDRRNSTDKGIDSCADGETASQKQIVKEDGSKQPGNVIVSNSELPKRKRGRPPKLDLPVHLKGTSDFKNKIKNVKNNVKKYSTAMLKSIEKNVKNRHVKLFAVKKNSKFKPNSKRSGKNPQLYSNNSKLKNIQKNKLKRKLLMASSKNIQKKNLKRSLLAVNTIISKQEMQGKADSADESVIQCQENIDNHLPLGNELDTSHIQSLVTEHNYSHIINSVIEDQLIADANNVATEIEIVTSNVENAPGSCEIDTSEANQKVETAESSEVNQQVENATPVLTSEIENASESQMYQFEVNQKVKNATPEVTFIAENVSKSQEKYHSEIDQNVEIVTSEVKVKRPRGRPRKNQNKESTSVSTGYSPVQKASSIDKSDETKCTNDTKDIQSEGETPGSVANENLSSAVRKSERVKRRKLVEVFESPKLEARKKDEETTLVIRTGRRGRPRKVPLRDSEVSISHSTTGGAVEKIPEIESGSADENLRKYSRKGRPRKCVRYADLNSGVDSSESLDGLNSNVKDKTEISKMRGDKSKKSQDTEHKENENAENNNSSYEQDEAIVLPLKKRKQRQAKKDDYLPEVTCSANTKDIADAESLLDEENMKKMELDSEDDELNNKKGQKSRNLRNHKTAKASARKKRMRQYSSDLESELSSYISCRNDESYTAPVTRRKSLNIDLLELEDETSDPETNDADINSRRDSLKRLNDSSLINRRCSARSVARSKVLKKAALKDSLQSAANVLSEFKPQKCAWKLLSGKDYYDFSPPMKYSPFFKTEKAWTGSETNWTSLSLFDSTPIDKESCHSTFFTGGPVLCSAWCPTPVENRAQYVALAISCSLDNYHSYVCTDSEKGLLQLWNVGLLRDKILESQPTMELCIAHCHGVITEMAWCPNGCWEDPSTNCCEDTMPRLGMLAVACSDSNVRIYSIPHPSIVTNESGFPIYESCPSIVLQPICGEVSYVTRKSMCISLSWQKCDNSERIAAGYGNGMICVWHINSAATILISKENNMMKISPYLVFNAHGTPVTSVCFAPLPGGRFLVSSSSDKTLKFWDLTDISLPFFAVKKGAARSAEWAHHYCGAFASLDHGMNCFKGSSFFKECGTENFPSRLLSNPSCSVTKSTMSEFLNAQAIADISGSVSVSFTHSLLQEHVKSPQYFHRPVYLTKMALVKGIIEKIAFSSYPESVNCIAAIQEMRDITFAMNKVTEKCCRKKSLNADSPINENELQSIEDISEAAPDSSASVICLSTIQEINDIVSVLTEIIEKCEETVLSYQDSTVTERCGELVPIDDPEYSANKVHSRKEIKDLRVVLDDKLSELTDIVTVVTDLKDIASTVNQLTINSEYKVSSCSVKLDADVSPETSLMEVDEDFEGNQASCLEVEVPVSNDENQTEVLKILLGLVDILVKEINATTEVNESKTDTQMQVLEKRLSSSKSVVENLCSESVACISAVQEMKDIVSIMDDITDKCEKVDPLNISLKTDMSDGLDGTVIKSGHVCDSELVWMEGNKLASSSGNVNSIIQEMKDIVSTLACVVKESSKEPNMNELERKILMSDNLTELFKKKNLGTCEETKDKKWIIQGTGLPFKFSEVTDIVGTVMDMRDVTAAMAHLVKACKGSYSIESPVSSFVSEIIQTNLLSQSDENPMDLESSADVISEISNDENSVTLETSVILENCIKVVSEEVDTELEVKFLLLDMVSVIQKVDKLGEETQIPGSSVSAENILKSGYNIVIVSKEDLPPDVSNELNTAKPSTKSSISNEADIQCNNNVPLTQSFNHKHLGVLEGEDEPMLSAESSNSENEMDTDDELEVAHSYMFDQKSGFSDDSYMSECSLNSNISMCSFSGDSDMSENSSDSVPGDKELSKLDLHSSSQNSATDSSQMSTKSPSLLSLISEMSQNSPSRRKDEYDNLERDSVGSVLLSIQKTETSNNQTQITSPPTEEIVSSSNCQEIVNLSSVSYEPNQSDNLDVSMESSTSHETLSNRDVAENVISVNSEGSLTDTSDLLSVDKSCDINSCSTEISESISCTENSEESVDMYLEKILQRDCNVLPKTDEKNIFDAEKVPESAVVNSHHGEDNEENRSISIETTPVVDKKTFSPENLSYENVISEYGLVFKDMNTAHFENIEDTSMEERHSLDQYHLASVKTIAWNPNYGSHFWLFSAGQSGIARISYISDINECKVSKTRDGKDS